MDQSWAGCIKVNQRSLRAPSQPLLQRNRAARQYDRRLGDRTGVGERGWRRLADMVTKDFIPQATMTTRKTLIPALLLLALLAPEASKAVPCDTIDAIPIADHPADPETAPMPAQASLTMRAGEIEALHHRGP
jgi:hypothetical protein